MDGGVKQEVTVMPGSLMFVFTEDPVHQRAAGTPFGDCPGNTYSSAAAALTTPTTPTASPSLREKESAGWVLSSL